MKQKMGNDYKISAVKYCLNNNDTWIIVVIFLIVKNHHYIDTNLKEDIIFIFFICDFSFLVYLLV
jgi:hypothetical protein